MASMAQSPASFAVNLSSKSTASDLLRSSNNGTCGVPLRALGRAQLGAKRRDFTVSAMVKKGNCTHNTYVENVVKSEKQYKLVEVETVVMTSTWTKLLTFTAKEADSDSDCVRTIQAMVHEDFDYSLELEQWRYKPLPIPTNP